MPGRTVNDKFNDLVVEEVQNNISDSVRRNANSTKDLQRRCSLYGTGPGAAPPMPKKSSSDPDQSKLWGESLQSSEHRRRDDKHGNKPGQHRAYEHELLYREGCYSTTTGNTDQRFARGVGKLEPWHVGYKNATSVTPGSTLYTVGRYGHRGANELKMYATNRSITDPLRTVEATTPGFLSNPSLVDEWAPPLKGCPEKPGGPSISSTRLWPETSQFVTGYKNKLPAESSWYNHETTIDGTPATSHLHFGPVSGNVSLHPPVCHTELSHKIGNVLRLEKNERDLLSMMAGKSKKSSLKDRTTSDTRTVGGPNDAVTMRRDGGGQKQRPKTMSSSSAHAPPKPPSGELEMKYSGPQMLIVNSGRLNINGNPDDAAFRFEFRRQEILRLHALMANDIASPAPTRVCSELGSQFKNLQLQRGGKRLKNKRPVDYAVVERNDFNEVLVQNVNGYSLGQANRLFSLFDVNGRGRIEYAEVLSMVLALAGCNNSMEEQISDLWTFLEEYLHNRPVLKLIEQFFMSCCHSRDQEEFMHTELRKVLKPAFYKYTASRGLMIFRQDGLDNQGGNRASNQDFASMSPGQFALADMIRVCEECKSTTDLFDAFLDELGDVAHQKDHQKKQDQKLLTAKVLNDKTRRFTEFRLVKGKKPVDLSRTTQKKWGRTSKSVPMNQSQSRLVQSS